MRNKNINILLLCVLFTASLFSQKRGIKDFLKDLNSNAHDTVKLKALNSLSQAYWKNNPDSALHYAEILLQRSKQLNNSEYESYAYNDLGVVNYLTGKFDVSIKYYLKSFELKEKNKDEKGIGSTANNIGLVYFKLGQYQKAVEYYLKSVTVCEKFKDFKKLANSYNNIGSVYNAVSDYKRAEMYYTKALLIRKLYNDSNMLASSYINMGSFYNETKRGDKALENYKLAVQILEKSNNLVDLASVYNNLGTHYSDRKDHTKALMYYNKSLELATQLNDSDLIMNIQVDIGKTYCIAGDITKALKIEEEVYDYGSKYKLLDLCRKAAEILSFAYEKSGKLDKALKFQKERYILNDSIHFAQRFDELADQELKYNYEKDQKALELEQQQIKIEHTAELQNKQKIILLSALGSILLVIMIVIIFRSLVQTRKTKQEIAVQKHLVEEKNKEITDSINYANRIQKNVLPDEKEIISSFSDGFVIYKPKDIVSGDLFWFNKIKTAEENNFVTLHVLIVLDCTGHGVPGAFMSMLAHTLLNQTTQIKEITSPSHVFNFLNKELIRNLNSKNSEQSINDGLEIALGAFDLENKKLYYSCAGNSILLVRNKEVIELKGNRHSVTANILYQKPFDDFVYEIERGDCFYFFTDGFPDQFGGPRQKKYKYKQLENKLLEIHHLPFTEQKEILLSEFNNWRGDLEQVDDVTIIGIRV